MLIGKQGDEIRMRVVVMPANLGANHSYPRIVAPFGTSITKALKIIFQ
jgi:hypothetical protein